MSPVPCMPLRCFSWLQPKGPCRITSSEKISSVVRKTNVYNSKQKLNNEQAALQVVIRAGKMSKQSTPMYVSLIRAPDRLLKGLGQVWGQTLIAHLFVSIRTYNVTINLESHLCATWRADK